MNIIIAKVLFWLGFPPWYSWGIHGFKTKGYGKLGDNGFWEYPLE